MTVYPYQLAEELKTTDGRVTAIARELGIRGSDYFMDGFTEIEAKAIRKIYKELVRPKKKKKKSKNWTDVEAPPSFSHFTAVSDGGGARTKPTDARRRAPRDASARFTQGGLASSDAARAKKTVMVKSKKGSAK